MKEKKLEKEWLSFIKYYGSLMITFYFKDFETYKMIRTDASYKDLFQEIALIENQLA